MPLVPNGVESAFVDDAPTVFGSVKPAGVPIYMWLAPLPLTILIVGGIGGFVVFRFLNSDEMQNSGAGKSVNNSNPMNGSGSSPLPTVEPSPTPIPTPDKAQLQSVINRSIQKSLTKGGAGETDKSKRRTVYGDIDGDGDEDVVVEYDWDFSAAGGTGWGSNLSAFRNNDGKYEWVADEEVGGKSSRTFKLTGIKNGKILGDTLSDSTGTFACDTVGPDCFRKKVQFVLSGTKLIEK